MLQILIVRYLFVDPLHCKIWVEVLIIRVQWYHWLRNNTRTYHQEKLFNMVFQSLIKIEKMWNPRFKLNFYSIHRLIISSFPDPLNVLRSDSYSPKLLLFEWFYTNMIECLWLMLWVKPNYCLIMFCFSFVEELIDVSPNLALKICSDTNSANHQGELIKSTHWGFIVLTRLHWESCGHR